MADLLTVLHDIDRMRGRICAQCEFYRAIGAPLRGVQPWRCFKFHHPVDDDDGCDDWQPRMQKDAAA